MRLTNRHIVWNIVIAGIVMLGVFIAGGSFAQSAVKTDSTNKAKITPVNTATPAAVINNKPLPTATAIRRVDMMDVTQKKKNADEKTKGNDTLNTPKDSKVNGDNKPKQ